MSTSDAALFEDPDAVLEDQSPSSLTGSPLPMLLASTASGSSHPRRSTTCMATDDPHFIEQFYSRSRLHFLSTWRLDCQAFVAQFLADRLRIEGSSIMAGGSKPPGAPTIVHIDLDAFFASASLLARPDLSGVPVAISHSESKGGTSDVASSNYAARKCGVANGMSMKKAKECCSGLKVLPYDFDLYKVLSNKFYAILCETRAWKIKAVSCDEAFFEISDDMLVDLTNETETEGTYDATDNRGTTECRRNRNT